MPKESSPSVVRSATTTNRAKAFMIDHLIGKKMNAVAAADKSATINQTTPNNELQKLIVATATNSTTESSDSNNNAASVGSTDRSARSATSSPVISSNYGGSRHSATIKSATAATNFQQYAQNFYSSSGLAVPLELTKSSSRHESSLPVFSTKQPASSSSSTSSSASASTSPVDLASGSGSVAAAAAAAAAAVGAHYYPFSQQIQLQNAQVAHAHAQASYYPYSMPIGFQGSGGPGSAGNFGFNTGMLPYPWGNPFLTMPQQLAGQSEKVQLLLSLNNRIGPFGVHYGPPRTLNSLTTLASKRKGGQIRFTNPQTAQLEKAFRKQQYLNANDRKKLALSLNLTDRQVKTWFQNRRAKLRKTKVQNSFENVNQVTRSTFDVEALDSPDEGRCESVEVDDGEEDAENDDDASIENVTHSTHGTSGGKTYVPSQNHHHHQQQQQQQQEQQQQRQLKHRGIQYRPLGHSKLISCT